MSEPDSGGLVVHQADGARFLASDLPPGRVAVCFCADWCGYCHRFLPHLKRIRDAWVVDVSDEEVPAWEAFDISVVPTVVVFEDGVPVKRWAGVLGEHHVGQVEAFLRGAALDAS